MLITRRVEFSASHACWNPDFPPERNRSLYGEAGPHGHGHNFVLEVTLEGEPDPTTGMVYDLKRLKDVLNEEVVNPMDHRFLNREVPPFDRLTPTTENISVEIWRRLAPKFSGNVRLHAVRVYETEDLYVEYIGGENLREAR
ncbi:MAG TPA: 6-carboxytetrahydropterin synthase [Bryobacteraceae bacterium]|nr:6-carboxytetrahydropterin synthase [Bryobacteraceae bacterium]